MDTQVSEEIPLKSEDSILAYAQSKRELLVNKVLENGVPGDTASRNILLTALADMDRVAIARKRIKVEEKSNSNQEQAAQIISKLLGAAAGKPVYESSCIRETRVVELPAEIPDPTPVPGETSTVVSNETYDSFMAKHGQPS